MYFLPKEIKEDMLSHTNIQSRGLIPVPSVLIFVYISILFIWHIFGAVGTFSSDIDHIQNPNLFDGFNDEQLLVEVFWLQPMYKGVSRIQFFEGVNVLFIIYMLISFLVFVTSKYKKRLYQWASYAFCMFSLIMLQIYFHKIDFLANNLREIIK